MQSVASPTKDPEVESSILAQSYIFMETDHEIISMVNSPSVDSRRVVVSYKQKYVHKALHLIQLAQEKVWLGILIVQT